MQCILIKPGILSRLVLSANRTAKRSVIGCWRGIVVCLSVCLSVRFSVRLSVTKCIVAKRYILQQKSLNKWLGSARGDTILELSTPTPTVSWTIGVSCLPTLVQYGELINTILRSSENRIAIVSMLHGYSR